MGMAVLATGVCACSFGAAPSVLGAPPVPITGPNLPVLSIMDHVPFLNIMPFAVCSSLANPVVAAATAAALGILTPMPCIPVTSPWVPIKPAITVSNKPILDSASITTCAWGGVITILSPGPSTCTLK